MSCATVTTLYFPQPNQTHTTNKLYLHQGSRIGTSEPIFWLLSQANVGQNQLNNNGGIAAGCPNPAALTFTHSSRRCLLDLGGRGLFLGGRFILCVVLLPLPLELPRLVHPPLPSLHHRPGGRRLHFECKKWID